MRRDFVIFYFENNKIDNAVRRCLRNKTKPFYCEIVLDPNETREWVLNNRVADRVEQLLKQNYTGYQLLRIDDTTVETDMYNFRGSTGNSWWFPLAIKIVPERMLQHDPMIILFGVYPNF